MTVRNTLGALAVIVIPLLLLGAGCNGDDEGSTPVATATATTVPPAATGTPTLSSTATRTATVPPSPTLTAPPTATPSPTLTVPPTATPTTQSAAGVSAVVLINRSVASRSGDALGAPPALPIPEADAGTFDRALAYADWSIAELADKRGVTAPDGSFLISGLAAGRYTLEVQKTLDGNLASVSFPFAVGADGTATLIAEMSWGLGRSTTTYADGAVTVRDVRGPYGTVLVTRDGRIVEIGDPGRTLVDSDGDGRFDPLPCAAQVWECKPEGDCGADRRCACTASCPGCEDCGPGVCVPPARISPYRCNDDDTCDLSSDRCVCVASCEACDDCGRKVCVPNCLPLEITAVRVTGAPSQLVVGRQGQAYATAVLSDGSQIDVTYLATWQSSNPDVATVDSWGTVSAVALGSTNLTATIGVLTSDPSPLEVVERPALRRLIVQNPFCYCGPTLLAGPNVDAALRPCILGVPERADILPVPRCGGVVLVGTELQFSAIGEFADGSYEDLTAQAAWQVAPAEVADVVAGLFTARQAGTAQLTAAVGDVVSDAVEIRVVTEPTVVSLSIYAENGVFAVAVGGVVEGGVAFPCRLEAPGAELCCCQGPLDAADAAPCGCGYSITVLRGDQLRFHATAQYDTGDWKDVTDQVLWRSSNGAAATIEAGGVMTAVEAGATTIDAVLAAIASNPVGVRVVNDATLESLSIYQDGIQDRVVAAGEQRFFKATAYYDVGFARDVTAAAVWRSSDDAVGGFDTPGIFTARTPGNVNVWAELGGRRSNELGLEVFAQSELSYCDPANINRAVWFDNYNRVTIESDCAVYTPPAVVTLRYTVTETQPHGGIFDPCLDLYVYRGETKIRTIREEGCGDPFLPLAAPGRDAEELKYQLRAFWDLKADDGEPVPPGVYTVIGRFYLYYDPVVRLPVIVTSDTIVPDTLPDLVPADVHLGACSVARCEAEQLMDVCVANEGASDAGPFTVLVNATAVRFTAMVAGDQQCQALPYLPQAVVAADSNGEVLERREDNNRRAFTVPAPEPTACDALPPGCTPSPKTPTPTPTSDGFPVCTPPLCAAGEVYFCMGECRGGCGTTCAPAAPTPVVEGRCFRQAADEKCTGAGFPTSQEQCCEIARVSASILATAWCASGQFDATGDTCEACGDPCAGVPTPMPPPTAPPASPAPRSEGACFKGSASCTGPFLPTSRQFCCDAFPAGSVASWCPDDQLSANGTCAACAAPCSAEGASL